MRWKSTLLAWLGVLLFYAGVFLGLALSGVVAWAQSEALVYSSFHGETNLAVDCPLIMSIKQPGVVQAEIVNRTKEEIKPVVTAEISHGKVPREVRQTVLLGPGGSQTVEWTVDSSDVMYERLILVNILQSPYSDNPSRSGSCGIFLLDLFGLRGTQIFALGFVVSLLTISLGSGLWTYTRWPLDRFSTSLVQIHSIMVGVTVLTLVSTLVGWWGLAIFFDVILVLIVGVIVTEFGFSGGKYRTSS